jgi:membrane protein insertase Oxa1/YidC/SpoIIIJ
MVLGQFSEGSANIRKLAKDHKGYGSVATLDVHVAVKSLSFCSVILTQIQIFLLSWKIIHNTVYTEAKLPKWGDL